MLLFFIVFQLQFFTTAEMFAVIGGLSLPLGFTTNTTFIMHQSQQTIIAVVKNVASLEHNVLLFAFAF